MQLYTLSYLPLNIELESKMVLKKLTSSHKALAELKGYGFKGLSSSKSGQNKGHFNQFQELLFQQENGGNPIIPFDEIVNTTKASFAAIESLKECKWISIK
jgi:hypothetical protein